MDVIALKFLLQNSALEHTVQQLSTGNLDLKFNLTERIEQPLARSPIWISGGKITDRARTNMWMPESEEVRKVLHKFNTDLGLELGPDLEPQNDSEISDASSDDNLQDQMFWDGVDGLKDLQYMRDQH